MTVNTIFSVARNRYFLFYFCKGRIQHTVTSFFELLWRAWQITLLFKQFLLNYSHLEACAAATYPTWESWFGEDSTWWDLVPIWCPGFRVSRHQWSPTYQSIYVCNTNCIWHRSTKVHHYPSRIDLSCSNHTKGFRSVPAREMVGEYVEE